MDQILVYVAIASPLLTVGAAWGGVKVGMNGIRATIKRVEDKLDRIDVQTQANSVAIAAQQTRCALLHPAQSGAPHDYPVDAQ